MYKKCFLFFIIINLIIINNGYVLLPHSDPTQCNSSSIFNFENLKCEPCDVKTYLEPDFKGQQCVCNNRAKPTYFSNLNLPQCSPCGENEIFVNQKCIKCENGLINHKNGSTACKPCKSNEILLFHDQNGTNLNITQCLSCKNGMVPSEDRKYCIPCPMLNPVIHNGTVKCLCDYKSVLLGNFCISTEMFPELSNDKRNFYMQNYLGEKVKSDLFDNHLKSSIYLCKMKNGTACQFLANLCTLTLFSSYENSPCGLWLENRFSNSENQKLPWLFYREGEANVIFNYKKISAEFSLNSDSQDNILNFTAVVLNLDGTFKEIKKLEGSVLNLCPLENHLKNHALRFGVNYQYNCKIDAQQLVNDLGTEFFIPYLQFWDENKSVLFPIPILVQNSGKNNNDDISNWQLVRRFFFVDKISSVSSDPKFITYLKSVEIRVKIRDDDNFGQIFPPLLVLNYDRIRTEDYRKKKVVDFYFSINFSTQGDLSRSIEISIGILTALAIVYSGIQTWIFCRRSGKIALDLAALFHFILYSCGNLANAFFLVAFGICVHIFIFYKGPDVVHMLLPSSSDEQTLKNFIIVAFSLKVIEVAALIWHQVTLDIFLIDWERPKPQDSIPRPNTSPRSSEESVSVWRSLFVANELNEIQTTRKINLLYHMITLAFFLQVLGFEFWGTSDSDLHTSIPEHLVKTPLSFICRFGAGAFLYLILYTIQLLYVLIFHERYIKNEIQEFVDICSLSNISIFIMSYERYGFYIHGRSSHGFADTDMATMIKQLKKEEDDLCGYRGLLPGTYQQTFIMGVPAKLRLYYNKLINTTFNVTNTSYSSEISPREDKKFSQIDMIVKTYHNINKFLCAFLEHALKDLDYDVRDRTFVEKLLNIELSDTYHRGVLFTDNGHSFDQILFYGNEFTLFTFDIILFSFILMLFDNFILSILTTIFFSEVIKIIRNYGGRRNLAKKTLIDERFLI